MGDVNGDGKNEIVTGGYYNDGAHLNAQVELLNASVTSTGLSVLNSGFWLTGINTNVASVAVADVNVDFIGGVVTGGAFHDGTRLNSKVTTWGMK